MLANLVVCYLSVVACTILAVFSFLLLVHDLIDHFLLHRFHIWIKSRISVEIEIKLLPCLVFNFGFIPRRLFSTICNALFFFLPLVTLVFDYIIKDELDQFKLQNGTLPY